MQIVDGLAMSDAEGNVLTEIVPVSDGLEQGPVVVTVKLNVPVADGDPEIVTTPALYTPVTPAGNPVTLAPVPVPPTE